MTLSIENISLQKSERATGGRMSGTAIVDGETNNLFPNLTTIDFTAGGINIGKAYAWINSSNVDQLRGAYIVLTKPPANPAVSVAMMSTRDWFDYVEAHRAHLSNYLSIGPRMYWIPALGGMVGGSLQIQVWGNTDTPKPEIGNTYILVQYEGLINETKKAVKVIDMSDRVETFDDERGFYNKRIVNLRLAAELTATFLGTPISRTSPGVLPTSFHATIAAGASRVWGTMKLADPVTHGDTSFSVESIYTQIVPASISETLATDQTAAGRSVVLIPGAGGDVSFDYSLDIGPGINVYLGQPAQVGSIQVIAGPTTLTESAGNLYSGSTLVATVDSALGLIMPVTGSPTYTGAKTISFKPAGVIAQPMQSASIPVTLANQSRVWSYNIPTKPTKGSIVINYLAAGAWYELRDNGTSIVGSSTDYGSASISSLNTLSMSFGTVPDVDSKVIIYWGVDVYTLDRSAASTPKAAFELNTTVALSPLTVSLAWTDSGGARTATDDGAGNLTGDATGTVYYGKKQILFRPTITPAKGTVVIVSVTPMLAVTETYSSTAVVNGGNVELRLLHPPIEGTVYLTYKGLVIPNASKEKITPTSMTGYRTMELNAGTVYTELPYTGADPSCRDDGIGGWTNDLAGTVDYDTGDIVAEAVLAVPIGPTANFGFAYGASGGYANYTLQAWTYAGVNLLFGMNGSIVISYLYGDPLTGTIEYPVLNAALLDFVPDTGEYAVPGSLRFSWAGKTYIEQNGAIYADVSNATGSGVWVGSLDLASRRATLTQWTGDTTNTPETLSLLTRVSPDTLAEITIKVPSPPVKVEGFSLRATQMDGTIVTATSDTPGILLDTGIDGKINYETGIAWVRFGDWVTAAGNEGEDWYHVANVVAGQVFKPAPVYAETVLYDATLQSRNALPADVIEIETATLPTSGALEVIRSRDMLYFLDDDSFDVATPTAGEPFDCERLGLERIWVIDADGVKVPVTKYTATTAELDAGVCHWANPLSLVGHATPWTVHHRISETRTVGTVGRFGTCRLRDLPFTRDYPAGAYVCSMLYAGHLFADWSVPAFFQTWQSWATAATGNQAGAAYDYGNFPIQVKNNGVTMKCRVALVFQDATHFRCLLEGFGQIDSNQSITADYSPINPATEQPIFTIIGNHDGDEPWGEGWSALNYIIFSLSPSSFPVELVRCVMPSDPVAGSGSATVEVHGNFG